MKALAFLLLTAAALPTFAQPTRDYADVLSVREIAERVNRPTERCWVERTERQGASERTPAGAIVGAIAGGILGHQVGGGTGRDIATGVGVLAGAVVGDNLANRDAAGGQQDVRRCVREDNWVREVSGYEVTYRYANQTYVAVLSRDPGRTLEVVVDVRPAWR